jgi:hypothetical protein
MFDFVMKMFSEGDAAIPALGMEEIPKQVAKQPDAFIFNTKVVDIQANTIITVTMSKSNRILLCSNRGNSLDF